MKKDLNTSNHPDPRGRERFNSLCQEQAQHEAQRPQIEADGKAALLRLLPIAQRDTGQSRVIARFLLGCYNGGRFPFDLTDFRLLDSALFDDCIAVLKMDSNPRQEVHRYFPDGGKLFERLAQDWGLSKSDDD